MSHHCQTNPLEKVCGYEYTVRRGDSFYLIANRLGIPLRDLLEANCDINPARLMVGDVLCIPMEEDDAPPEQSTPQEPAAQAPAETTPQPSTDENDLDSPAAPSTDPASPGDSGSDSGIFVCPESQRHTVTPGETTADIQLRANLNLRTLQQANPEVDLNRLAAGQTICVPESSIPCALPPTYTLLADDTLESVALRLNASLSALLRANPCLAPGDFRSGACIFIPED